MISADTLVLIGEDEPDNQVILQTVVEGLLGVRAEVRRTLSDWFSRYDAILSPTVAWPAPKALAGWVTPYPDDHMGTNLTAIVNFATDTGDTAATRRTTLSR